MRLIGLKDIKQRGCNYCKDSQHVAGLTFLCQHDECPFWELEGFKTYKDYLDGFAKIDIDLYTKMMDGKPQEDPWIM